MGALEAVIGFLGQGAASPVARLLFALAPAAIMVAALAGWRKAVPGAGVLALGGAVYCLWLFLPLRFDSAELAQLALYATILGWVWLVGSWGRFVLTEWPAPMWGHWLAGTVLVALPFAVLVGAMRA